MTIASRFGRGTTAKEENIIYKFNGVWTYFIVACYMFYPQNDRIEEYITNRYRDVETKEPVVCVSLHHILDIPSNLLDFGIHQEHVLLLDCPVGTSASLCSPQASSIIAGKCYF